MFATTPELLSPPSSSPSSFRPDTEDSRRESVVESLGGNESSRPKRIYNILKRHRSSSSVDNQTRSQQPTSLPPLNSDGTRPWVWNTSRDWTSGNIEGQTQSPSLVDRFMPDGGRRRRNSDSTPPEAFAFGQVPISPLDSSFSLPQITTGGAHVPSPPRNDLLRRPKILFYHKHQPHYGFTNFSSHSVKYEGKVYPTSEHLFQSLKVMKLSTGPFAIIDGFSLQFTHRPQLAEHIRTCSLRPSVAFSEARRFAPEVREDWSSVSIEFECRLSHLVGRKSLRIALCRWKLRYTSNSPNTRISSVNCLERATLN